MGRTRLRVPAMLPTVLLSLLLGSCGHVNRAPGAASGDSTTAAIDPGDLPEPTPPAGHTLLATAIGDLDGDGSEDLAIAWSGPVVSGTGAIRKLMLYKAAPVSWKLWHESTGPIMAGTADGVSGDPFHSLSIENGSLVINHIGGGRARWDYLHRYRLNGLNWELATATISYGELCDTFTTIDYDLSSGAVDVNRESNNCDETGTEVPGKGDALLRQFTRKQGPVPMDGFKPGANPLETPDKTTIYY